MNRKRLDLRGEICPFTLIHTKKEVAQLSPGDLLEVWIDNEDATETIPNWGRHAGHQVEATERLSQGGWAIRLTVKG